MPSLAYFLNRTKELCGTIQSLEFRAPGIFTNSFIAEPSITTLLKDAEEYELSLYKIKKPIFSSTSDSPPDATELQLESKPERVDGKSVYVDHSFSEFTNHDKKRKRTAVSIPDIIKPHTIENNEKSSPSKLLAASTLTNNIDEICGTALDLIRKYPNLVKEDEEANLLAYRDKYGTLVDEISQLETLVTEQRDQLAMYNVTLNDATLTSSPLKQRQLTIEHNYEESEIEIDELIRQEEQEIEELEAQLNNRQ